MKILENIRKQTKSLHEQIEQENKAKYILDHSITEEDYKILLIQNYIAYRVVESEIKRFIPEFSTDKSDRIYLDLISFGLPIHTEIKHFRKQFNCSNYLESLGASYVLEGSAMGGMLLARELQNCTNLQTKKHHFFNGDRNNAKSWNAFLKTINNTDFTEEEQQIIVEKAKETFLFFEEVFRYDVVY